LKELLIEDGSAEKTAPSAVFRPDREGPPERDRAGKDGAGDLVHRAGGEKGERTLVKDRTASPRRS